MQEMLHTNEYSRQYTDLLSTTPSNHWTTKSTQLSPRLRLAVHAHGWPEMQHVLPLGLGDI